MEVTLKLGSAKPEQLVHFKNYLEQSHLAELESVGFKQKNSKKGEMGFGLVGTELTAVFSALASPFTRFADVLIKYIDSFKTEIILKNEKGEELILNTRRIAKEDIHTILQTFFDKGKKGKKTK